MMKALRSKKGFTLVEILVVILIIGILFVAFLPRIDFAGDKARETNVKTDLRTFMVGSEQLFKENSGLPDRAGAGADFEKFAGKNTIQINKLLDPSLQLKDATTETHANSSSASEGLVSALADPWKESYRVDIYSNYPTTNKQAILITSHGKEFVGNEDTADYGALVIYEEGRVSSCTFGLNSNIGTFMNNGTAAYNTDTTSAFAISGFAVATAKCGN